MILYPSRIIICDVRMAAELLILWTSPDQMKKEENFQSTISSLPHLPREMSFIHSIYIDLPLYCAAFCISILSTIFLMSCLILMGLWWKWKSGRWRRMRKIFCFSFEKESWAWKMKIFPINTKLNEHDFWDIDGFQFFFVFHLCEKKRMKRKSFISIFFCFETSSWEMREKKVFLLFFCGIWIEWMVDGNGVEGDTEVVFNRSLLLMRNGSHVSQIHHCQSI